MDFFCSRKKSKVCHNQFLYHSTFLFFSFSPSVAMSSDINTNLCIFCNDKSDCAVQELHNRLKTPLISMRTTLKLLTFQAQLFKHTHNQFNMIQTMDIYSRYAWTLIYLYFLNIRLGSLCPCNQFVKLKKNYSNLFFLTETGRWFICSIGRTTTTSAKTRCRRLNFRQKLYGSHVESILAQKSWRLAKTGNNSNGKSRHTSGRQSITLRYWGNDHGITVKIAN